MHRWETILNHVGTLLVGVTGVVYAVMRYFLTPSDPYSVVNHPLQPHMQHLHVLVAPVLVFGAGVIWRRHVMSKLRVGFPDGRRSGLGLILSLIPMVTSGYLIQVTVEPGWRRAWVAIHLVTSGAWLLAYAVHQVRLLLLGTEETGPDALELHAGEVHGDYPARVRDGRSRVPPLSRDHGRRARANGKGATGRTARGRR